MSTDAPPLSPPSPPPYSTAPPTKKSLPQETMSSKEPAPPKDSTPKPTTVSIEDSRPTLMEFLTQIQELYNTAHDSALKGALRKRRIRRRNQSTACIHLMSLAWFAMTFLFIAAYLMTHPPVGGCSGHNMGSDRMLRCERWKNVYVSITGIGATMGLFCIAGSMGLYYGRPMLINATAGFYLVSSLVLSGPFLMLSRHMLHAIIDQSFEEYMEYPFYMLPAIAFFMLLFTHGFMSMLRLCRSGFVALRDRRIPTAQDEEASRDLESQDPLQAAIDDEITKAALLA